MEAAFEHRVPTVFGSASMAESGGLIAYGTNVGETPRRAASYVDRILKGAKPGDLPVEMPSEYRLTINLKAARALGITIAQSVLLRADRVIE